MNQDYEVRFSDYTVMGPLPEDCNSFIAINTLTDSVALLEGATIDAIKGGVCRDDRALAMELDELERTGIIVPKQKNEIYSLRYSVMQAIKPMESSHSFQIYPTMGCNLTCPYCYAWRSTDEAMSEETAIRVTDWMKEQIDARNLKDVNLSFCGGEPLLKSSLVLEMAREISAHCKEKDVTFSQSITTNGVFLTREFVQQMLDFSGPCGDFAAQITIDGPAQVHDSRRTARDGSSSFDAIIRNLRDLSDLETGCRHRLKISIRINVDRLNVDSIMALAEELQPLVVNGVVGGAYLAPVNQQAVPHDEFVMSEEEWLAVVPPLWYKIAEAYNMDVSFTRRMKPCGEFKEMATLIGPDGSLYSCQGFAGDPDFALGNIDMGFNIAAYEEHYGLMPWSECMGKCPLVTWCWAGCRLAARGATGDWKARLCRKQTIIGHALEYYRFKHRDRIAKWLYNKANGIQEDEYADFKEIAISQV